MASGSVITSQAPRLAVFLVGRALSGVGGAAVFPVSLILIIELTSVRRRGLYIGCVNTCYTIGIALGAVIAGALDSLIGWRGIFALQAPLALIAGVGVFLAIPSFNHDSNNSNKNSTTTTTTSSKTPHSILALLSQLDLPGLLLLVLTIVLLLYSLSSTPQITYPTLALSLLSLSLFLAVESRPCLLRSTSSQPILPLPLLLSPPILLTSLATLTAMTARCSILFYTPVYALSVRAFSPTQAGLILLPTNAGSALGNLLVGHFHVRRSGSFYTPSVVVYACFAVSVLAIALITTQDVWMGWYFVVAGVNGFMIGASMVYALAHVLHRTPGDSHFIVSGLIATFRGLSASFGSAIGGGVFSRILKKALTGGFEDRGVSAKGKRELIRKLSGSPALVSKLAGIEREVAVEGYVVALRTLFMTAAVVAVVSMVLQAGTGWRAVEDDGRVGGEEEEEGAEEDDVQIYVAG
jgi:predicted MFS family arabinose efflux permease